MTYRSLKRTDLNSKQALTKLTQGNKQSFEFCNHFGLKDLL